MGLRILIIRFSSIGDIVLTSPLMRCLKNTHPDAHITFVCKESFRTLLSANPYIDEVLTLKDGWATLKKELKAKPFDYLLDLHNNLRSKRLVFGLSGKYRAFPKLNIEKWLLVNLKIRRMPALHIVDRYLQTANELGVQYDGAGLDYFFPEASNPPTLPQTPYVCLAIGGQHATKRLPFHKLAEIIAQCKKTMVLLGGKEDKALADKLVQQFPDKQLLNYCGMWSLAESAWAVKGAEWLLTHDTGMMHIAAALRIPTLSIWGNTVPEFGMYPFYPEKSTAQNQSERFEVKGLSCRPCSKIGYARCPKGHFNCMELQDTAAIALRLNVPPSTSEK